MNKRGIWVLVGADMATLGCGDGATIGIDRLAYRPNGDPVVFSARIDIYDAGLRRRGSIPSPAGRHAYRQSDLSADGDVAIVVDDSVVDGATAHVLAVPGGEPIATFLLPGLGLAKMGTALSPHGDLVFVDEIQAVPGATDQAPRRIEVFGVRAIADGTPLWTLPGRLGSPYFSPDGATVFGINHDVAIGDASSVDSSAVEAYDATTGAPKFVVSAGGRLANLALAPGGQTLVGVLGTCISRGCWEYMATWSLTDGSLLTKVPVPDGTVLGGGAPMMSCAATEVVCASQFSDGANQGISLWRPDGTFLRAITRKEPWFVWPVVSPDGQFVVATGDQTYVYRVGDGSLVGEVRAPQDGLARSLP